MEDQESRNSSSDKRLSKGKRMKKGLSKEVILEEKLTAKVDECKYLKENLIAKDVVLRNIDESHADQYAEISKLREEIRKLEKEKDEALLRLSKLAGEKLRKENPGITDLSNANRPTKLGERWGSLYTDEWTDAYDDILNHCQEEEHQPEKKLIRIVDWCYKRCNRLAENHLETIKNKFRNFTTTIFQLEPEDDTSNRNQDTENVLKEETVNFCMEHFQNIRQKSPSLTEAVKNKCVEEYMKQNPLAFESEIKFIQKCSELCWIMCITVPQMVIEYKNFEHTPIDTNKFNKYTETGNKVEFVVWPVVLLHDNGPVIMKGTVQTNKSLARENDPAPTKCTGNASKIEETNKTCNKIGQEKISKNENLDERDFLPGNIQTHERLQESKNSVHKHKSEFVKALSESMVDTIEHTSLNVIRKYEKGQANPLEHFKRSKENNVQKILKRQASFEDTLDLPNVIFQRSKSETTYAESIVSNEFYNKNTKYYIKPEKLTGNVKHTDTLKRSFQQLADNTVIPKTYNKYNKGYGKDEGNESYS